VNEQVATPGLDWLRVHGEEPIEPDGAVPVTVPVGVAAVPGDTVSATVAVQVLLWPCCTVAGEQDTTVVVGWGATTRVVLPELFPWPSVAVNAPLTR
jgi:hypothetical protein